jgi:hypothetical protein
VTFVAGALPSDDDGVDNDCDGVADEAGEPASCPEPVAPGPVGPVDPAPSVPGPEKGASSAGATGLPGRDGANGVARSVSATGAVGPAVNGEGASPRARLTAGFARGAARGKVVYGKTIVVSGRLVDESGRPIRNAIIDVAETKALRGARSVSLPPVVTGSDGGFTTTAAGVAGTRSLSLTYRYQREGPVVASATLGVTVKAAVRLAVKLKGIVASYSGRVLAGSMPRGGKLVIVQGRAKGGSWQTFASRRAGKNGTFKGRYRLKIRRPGKKLQFRVRVLAESGWNYGGVTSKAVTRTVR